MIKRLTLSMLLISTAFFQSCKKETESELSIFQKKISQTWKLSVAILDGVDVTNYYPNLTIAIGSSTITASNGINPLWKSSVAYAIVGSTSPFQLQRADGITMTAISIDDTKLILEFTYDAAAAGGRNASVSGKYHVEFTLS